MPEVVSPVKAPENVTVTQAVHGSIAIEVAGGKNQTIHSTALVTFVGTVDDLNTIFSSNTFSLHVKSTADGVAVLPEGTGFMVRAKAVHVSALGDGYAVLLVADHQNVARNLALSSLESCILQIPNHPQVRGAAKLGVEFDVIVEMQPNDVPDTTTDDASASETTGTEPSISEEFSNQSGD